MSTTFQEEIRNKLKTALKSSFPELTTIDLEGLEVVTSTQEKFGHYQCNSAMKLAKVLKKAPRQVAEAAVKELATDPLFQKIEVEGPGFINITLKPEPIANKVEKILVDAHLDVPQIGAGKKVVIDFSSPNTAKEMHVGHLRSTIIGDAIARVLEFQGFDVLRLNHLGDWGTAFGMLIAYLKKEAPAVISGEKKASLTDLVGYYRASKQLFDADPAFKKTSQLEVVSLQGGDPDSLKGWDKICAISRIAYQEIYDLLDIHLIERGESFYNPRLLPLIAELEAKGFVTLSEGAKCIFLEGFTNREGEPLPLMLQKSDGGFGYDTTDMAAIKQRIFEEKADRIIIVTDLGQATHFEMIFAAAEKVGFLDRKKTRVDHVGFGLVLGADNKKFKTRSGDSEKLIDLLTKAIAEAARILHEKNPELPAHDLKAASEILGLGAVKYSDLSTNRMSDYVFSYDKMLRFEGNTAAFILYSYVRVGGIKRKLGLDTLPEGHITLTHPSEVDLALHLTKFAEAIDQVADSLLPNRLTDYLYTLAEKFNAFFRDCLVAGSPEQTSRLMLSEATARTLKQGLNLLGIKTLERM